ncbi:hypothetical protein [Streptomyces sp. BE133]|uniref:hypothetical protein n=1 Tax=Streptomyces sp. BE133 TaxID=3002523 RepID=UPI002E7630DC|nr:hypothetical protein [Streptomyces sp. BE133]MEE1810129.1 hypothetical protein [Streptomyces sp. BE133]
MTTPGRERDAARPPGLPGARTLTSTAASVVHEYRQVARKLFAARDACTGEQQLVILARALRHVYLRDGGRGAHGLGIAFTDAELADFSIDRAGRKHAGTACRAGRIRESPVGRGKQRSNVSGG